MYTNTAYIQAFTKKVWQVLWNQLQIIRYMIGKHKHTLTLKKKQLKTNESTFLSFKIRTELRSGL